MKSTKIKKETFKKLKSFALHQLQILSQNNGGGGGGGNNEISKLNSKCFKTLSLWKIELNDPSYKKLPLKSLFEPKWHKALERHDPLRE